jgi:hypothetical protein
MHTIKGLDKWLTTPPDDAAGVMQYETYAEKVAAKLSHPWKDEMEGALESMYDKGYSIEQAVDVIEALLIEPPVPQKKKYYYVVQVKTFNEYWYMTSTCKYETFQEYRECMPLTDEQVIAYTKIPEELVPSDSLPF